MNGPPRFPRALFIAALAVAASALAPLEQRLTRRPTPAQIVAQRATLAQIVKRFGAAFLAAGAARDAFDATGRVGASLPKKPRIDPIAQAVMDSIAVQRAIGKPAERCDNAVDAWIEIDRAGARPLLRIFWRGALIAGDRPTRGFSREGDRGRVVRTRCAAPASRALSLEHMRDAMNAARDALRDAGVALTPFHEVRRLERADFRGAVATIGLG